MKARNIVIRFNRRGFFFFLKNGNYASWSKRKVYFELNGTVNRATCLAVLVGQIRIHAIEKIMIAFRIWELKKPKN